MYMTGSLKKLCSFFYSDPLKKAILSEVDAFSKNAACAAFLSCFFPFYKSRNLSFMAGRGEVKKPPKLMKFCRQGFELKTPGVWTCGASSKPLRCEKIWDLSKKIVNYPFKHNNCTVVQYTQGGVSGTETSKIQALPKLGCPPPTPQSRHPKRFGP